MRADEVLAVLEKRHRKDLFITGVKNGSSYIGGGTLVIMDALAIVKSWASPQFTGYEVKVSRSDFVRDDKWPRYLDMCHRFFFAAPKGVITKADLPEHVGLITVDPETRMVRVERRAPFRDMKLSADMIYYLLLCKTDSDRHPFFSSRREMLMEWILDKSEKAKLGHDVAWRLSNRLDTLQVERDRAREDAHRFQGQLNELREVLQSVGISTTEWNWRELLKDRLLARRDPKLERLIRQLINVTDELGERLGSAEALARKERRYQSLQASLLEGVKK